jgi:hypothetical protein
MQAGYLFSGTIIAWKILQDALNSHYVCFDCAIKLGSIYFNSTCFLLFKHGFMFISFLSLYVEGFTG